MFTMIAGLAGALPIAAALRVYRRLQRRRARVDEAWRRIDAALRHRADLVPTVARAVTSQAADGRRAVEELDEARVRVCAADGARRMAAEHALGGALIRLLAATDACATTQRCPHFRSVQAELTRVQAAVSQARQRYNDAVRDYDAQLAGMPTALRSWLALEPSTGPLPADPFDSRLTSAP